MWGWEGQPPSLGDRYQPTQALATDLPYNANSGRPRSSSASEEPASFTGNAWKRTGARCLPAGERADVWAREPLDVAACLMCPSRLGRSRWSREEAPASKVSTGPGEQKKPPTYHTTPAVKLVLPRSGGVHRRQLVPVFLLEKQLFPKLLNHTPLCLGKGTCK